jgi:hypothetical protein
MAIANVTGLGYLGMQITFLDLDFYEGLLQIGASEHAVNRKGKVLAVQVPDASTDVEVLLLIRDSVTNSDDYYCLDRIEVKEVCSL